MSNFDDLSMAVASFGGNNAVKFDDLGMPSIMVDYIIPSDNWEQQHSSEIIGKT